MYCLDVNAIVLIGMIVVCDVMALVFLLDRRLYHKAWRIHFIMLSAMIFWCLFALIFGGLIERGYAAITLAGTIAVELVVRKRRKLQQQVSLK